MGQRVLVAEDDRDTRESLAQLLRLALGLEVETAADGQAAQALLERGDFALVVADQRMPHLTGADLLEWTKRHRPDVVRALMTAYQDGPALADRAGAQLFFKKPLELDEILAAVRRSLPAR